MMTEKELIERDQKRDLGAELLESVRQMKAGQRSIEHRVQVSNVSEARHKIGLSQTQSEVMPIEQAKK